MKDLLSSPLLVLSPHADDAALSCGGLLLQHQDAAVVTAFSGDAKRPRPRALAGLASPTLRRAEDAAAVAKMACTHHCLNHSDAMDRRDSGQELLYRSAIDLFGAVSPADAELCRQMVSEIVSLLSGRILLCPLAVGAHVDHQLCAHVGRRLASEGHSVWYYEDAPYVFPDTGSRLPSDSALHAARRLRASIFGNWQLPIRLSQKEEVLACYSSQIEALFGDIRAYAELAQAHYDSLGGALERFYLLRFR